MLDSANYNTSPVNVTKSVSILAIPGTVGSLVAAGGPALSVTTPSVALTLDNLRISALAGGTGGIVMTSGWYLTVRNTVISSLPGKGIEVSGPVAVRIVDTTVGDCGDDGVQLRGGVQATLSRVLLSRNGGSGLSVVGTLPPSATVVEVFDSIAEGNHADGFFFTSLADNAAVRGLVRDSKASRNSGGMFAISSSTAVWLTVTNSVASNNQGVGIGVNGAGTRLWVNGSTSVENYSGLYNYGGFAESAGNNAARNNTVNVNGSIASVGTL
jgi:hypothetical protein